MPLLEIVALFLLGGIVGTLSAFIGIGGGIILVPALIFLGLDPHLATGTSLVVVLFTGLSSAIAYFRQGRVDWKTGLILELTTAPGGYLGALLTAFTSSEQMKVLFAMLMALVSYKMWKEELRLGRFAGGLRLKRIVGRGGGMTVYQIDIIPAMALSFLAGLSSGFFGIGGGVLKVPILVAAGTPVHVAVATSSFMIVITALSGLIVRTSLGHVMYSYLLGLVPGTVFGAQVGARIAGRTKSKIIRRVFALILLTISIYMIVRSI